MSGITHPINNDVTVGSKGLCRVIEKLFFSLTDLFNHCKMSSLNLMLKIKWGKARDELFVARDI